MLALRILTLWVVEGVPPAPYELRGKCYIVIDGGLGVVCFLEKHETLILLHSDRHHLVFLLEMILLLVHYLLIRLCHLYRILVITKG